jgi:hypothetical protein
MLNAQLYSLTGLFARHNWLNRTFPLSDFAFLHVPARTHRRHRHLAFSLLANVAVDSENDRIFAANYYGGYIDVIDLRSQRTRKYIIAQGLGRHINLKPGGKSEIYQLVGNRRL